MKASKKKKSTFKFVLIEVSYLNNERHWFLLIENLIDLFNHYEQICPSLIENYFKVKAKKRSGHCSSDEEYMIETMFYNDFGSKGVIDDMFHISDSVLKDKTRMIFNGEKLLINSTGIGYCTFIKKYHKTIKVIQKDEYIRPDAILTENDIKITKWPKGRHWYLRIGNHDFGKFSTFGEANHRGSVELKKLLKGTLITNEGVGWNHLKKC